MKICGGQLLLICNDLIHFIWYFQDALHSLMDFLGPRRAALGMVVLGFDHAFPLRVQFMQRSFLFSETACFVVSAPPVVTHLYQFIDIGVKNECSIVQGTTAT